MTDLLTMRECAEYLRTSESTIKLWRDTRGLPGFHIGKRVYFRLEAVREWVARHEQASTMQPSPTEEAPCDSPETGRAAGPPPSRPVLAVVPTDASAAPSAPGRAAKPRPEPTHGLSKSEAFWQERLNP